MSNSENPYDKVKENTIHLFQAALGKSNVSEKDNTVELQFDLSKPHSARMFNVFGIAAAENKITFATAVDGAKDARVIDVSTGHVRILVPLDESPIMLQELAMKLHRQAQVNFTENRLGEYVCDVTPDSKAYALVEHTQLPWQHVIHSRYGDKVIEPKLTAPVDEKTRRNHEMALGIALLPAAHGKVEMDSWLAQQQEVEHTKKLPPRTAIPSNWAEKEGAKTRIEESGVPLDQVFKR
jgi:hypothetical protein